MIGVRAYHRQRWLDMSEERFIQEWPGMQLLMQGRTSFFHVDIGAQPAGWGRRDYLEFRNGIPHFTYLIYFPAVL